ncbi:MAG: T9SS type A sorting domain-containing protein [Ferruginibacter sp.]
MKKILSKILALGTFVLATAAVSAQVTTNSGSGLAASYPDLASAITALNAATISSPVTITLAGNETAPAGGYAITASGTSTNTIIISGSGGSIITSNAGLTAGSLNDGIFKLIGADYVTIQNFTMQENAANTVVAAATNNMTEWGVALLYASTTNGSQNNTIQNNTITLNRTYLNSFGIYSNSRHSAIAVTTLAEVTSAAGSNSNNKFYGNTITNVNLGISLVGAGTTIAAIDNGNDIGGSANSTGNIISNWGNGPVASSFISVTTSPFCIFSTMQINDNISYNTLTSAALTTAVSMFGIVKAYTVAQPVGTITTSINNNTVTITNNTTGTTVGSVFPINNQGLTPLLSTATVNINNNTIQNCILGGTTATTAGITCIGNSSVPGILNMNGNNIINNSITATTSTTGIVACVTNSGAVTTANMNNNIIRGLSSTAASGQIQGMVNSGAVITALNINSNQLGNTSGGFFTGPVATSGGLFAIVTSGGAATCTTSITGNDIRGITYSVASSAGQAYIQNTAASLSQNISNNTFTNLTVNTTGSATFISNSIQLPAGGSQTINNNSIVTGFSKTGAGGTVQVYLASASPSSPTGSTHIATGNNFSNITVTGATGLVGWSNLEGAPGPTKTISNNTFTNWTGGSSAITVITTQWSGGTSAISNNIINNITGTGSITGINRQSSGGTANETISGNTITGLVSTGTGGTVIGINGGASGIPTHNINGNTISGLSSTGTSSAVTGILISSGTTANIFRNNIYNISSSGATPTVTGITSSGATTTNIYNNFVSNLTAPSGNANQVIAGINISGGTAANVLYNTVYLGSAGVLTGGAAFGGAGLYISSTSPTVVSRNNIFNVKATGATGYFAAMKRTSGTAGTKPANLTASNNIYNAPYIYGEGTTLATATNVYYIAGGTAGTADPAFNSACGLYKVFMAENGTFSEDNLTAGAGNTFAPAGATYAESNAAPTTPVVTDDYNGVTRAATPDEGALEFAGIATDATGPSITYTALLNTVCLSGPVLSATITDVSGVNVSAGLAPRVYYRKGGATAEADVFGNYPTDNNSTFNGWKYVEATGTAPNFSFAIDYSKLTSPVALGDSIVYFVIAQDLAATPNVSKNVITFNSGFCPTSVNIPNTGAAPTSNPANYKIVSPVTTQPSTANAAAATANNQVIRVDLPAAGCGNITQIVFNTNGTTNTADLAKARVYYTTSTTFSTAIQFGTDVISPSGVLTFNGTVTPSTTLNNYFWLVYDISCSAPSAPSNVIDAEFTNLTLGGTPLTAAIINPTGTRTIVASIAGDNVTNAIAATGNTMMGYSNIGAGLDAGEPSPILAASMGAINSGTFIHSNYAWGTAADNTVWFKFTATGSGNYIIRNKTVDGQIAVWDLPNMTSGCGATPNWTGARLLNANEDNSAISGSVSQAVVRTRLTPGNTYYIQVDQYSTSTSADSLIIEDMALAPYSAANNGLGNYHNPTAADMRFASYEVNGADGWTYYYNKTTAVALTDVASDKIIAAVKWGNTPNYYYGGTYLPGTEMVNHLKRDATSTTAPSTTGVLSSADSIIVWSGRNNAAAASADLKPTAPYVNAASAHWWMMNKFWSLIPAKQPTTPVDVRTFYSDADFTALQAAVTTGGGVLVAHTDMRFIKATKSASTHYTNAELDPALGHATLAVGTVTDLPWINTDAVETGINQSQFTVSTFSGGGGGSTGLPAQSPVPVTLMSFTAQRTGKVNVIDWSTSQELNSNYFALERSSDGRNFTTIAQVAAAGYSAITRLYSYIDNNPVIGTNYYRLRIVDKDNSSKYSWVRTVRNEGVADVALYPNPVHDVLTVSISADKANNGNLIITDINGKLVYSKSISLVQGNNNLPVNLSNVAAGAYIIKVQLSDDVVVKKFNKL